MLSRKKKACGLFGIFALSLLLVLPSPAQTPGNAGSAKPPNDSISSWSMITSSPRTAPSIGKPGAVPDSSFRLRAVGSKTTAFSRAAFGRGGVNAQVLQNLCKGAFAP